VLPRRTPASLTGEQMMAFADAPIQIADDDGHATGVILPGPPK